MADSYYSKPQREEYFLDSGYYKFYEAYHLLKFSNEKQILEKAYNEYLDLKKSNLWGSKKMCIRDSCSTMPKAWRRPARLKERVSTPSSKMVPPPIS